VPRKRPRGQRKSTRSSNKPLVAVSIIAIAIVITTAGAWALSGGFARQKVALEGEAPSLEAAEDAAPAAEPEADGSEPEPADATAPLDEPAPLEPASEPAETGSEPVGASITPPTGDQQARMFWEQYDSNEQIQDLVEGRIAAFSMGSVTKSSSQANIGVTAAYSGGGSLSGTMVLRNYSGTWYFSSITRSGGGGPRPPRRPADTGVVSTIVAQQAQSQDIITGFIDGGYKRVEVHSASRGSGTATLDVTLSGGSLGRTPAQIVCVVKDLYGDKHWFITTFRER
jgi:hypothetical protein